MIHVILSSLPGITFMSIMLLLALKDNFLCTYRFSLREARSCSGHCPPLQGSVTAAHGAMCTVSVSNTERTHFCCISPPLSNYGEIKAVSLAKVHLHKSNVCAKPPVPALPCREFPRAEAVNFRLFCAEQTWGSCKVFSRSPHI